MSDVAELKQSIESLKDAVVLLAQIQGARLNRDQMCQRLNVHRNTLARRLLEPGFPQPGRDGKWLLSEVIEWESRR